MRKIKTKDKPAGNVRKRKNSTGRNGTKRKRTSKETVKKGVECGNNN